MEQCKNLTSDTVFRDAGDDLSKTACAAPRARGGRKGWGGSARQTVFAWEVRAAWRNFHLSSCFVFASGTLLGKVNARLEEESACGRHGDACVNMCQV